MTETSIHECGGTILTAENDGAAYNYCDNCKAFNYEGKVPDGTDPAENKRAWDDGQDRSPDA